MGNKAFDPKKEKFIQEIMKDGNASRAAKASGSSDASAAAQGYQMVRDPYVVAALEKVRKNSIKMATFNADEALRQADEAIEFAISSDNANAYVKALELKSKIQGLLVDKIDVRAQVAFTVMMSPLRPQPPPMEVSVIEALPSSAATQPAPTEPPGEQDLPMPVEEAVGDSRNNPVADPGENPFEGIDDGSSDTLDDPFAD